MFLFLSFKKGHEEEVKNYEKYLHVSVKVHLVANITEELILKFLKSLSQN